MEICVNETPKRTSRNFRINNIKLDETDFPMEIGEFNSTISQAKIGKAHLDYGLGDRFLLEINEHANNKVKIIANGNKTLEFKFDDKNLNLVDHIQILANESTTSTIVIKYLSTADENGYHNGLINLVAENNSNVNIILINLLNENTANFLSIQNNLAERANVNYTIIDFGGKYSITNYYSNITGDFASNSINTVYLGKNTQVLDLNYIAELRGKKNNINIDVQGALSDNAKKHFKGTIDFKKGCKKSLGSENENCMLLSDTAKSISLPMLLCTEEDVEGNHSCSAGKIDEKELFYIMSRGFSSKEAIKLMVKAKFNKIFETIPNKDLREEISNEVDKRLG